MTSGAAHLPPFGPATARWFAEAFPAPTPVQVRGWARIAAGEHALLVAPTGSGKTLAAFLFALDRLAVEAATSERAPGYRVVYVSPLKALVHDVERNLRAPLAGIRRTAEALGLPAPAVRVDVRTGDTPQRERERQRRDPGDVLVTTPESLYLLLGSRAGANLATAATLIVDEIHALAPTKRGAHLALSLERLCARVLAAGGDEPQRVGLSATARPLDEVARFLGGDREVAVVDAGEPPRVRLSVRVPVPDMERVLPPEAGPLGPAAAASQDELAAEGDDGDDGAPLDLPSGSILGQLYHVPGNRGAHERGIWPSIYPEILAEVRAHRSTIVFVNNRALAERLAQRLNDLAGEELVLSHHGSVSHEKRAAIEDRLKRGDVRGIVATSSLELGIDMGAVDLVLLVESPGSVARGLQRVGRAGHQVGAESAGVLFPKFRGDLLECAVVVDRMQRGEIEALRVPRNPLDVLAQQVVAICCDGETTVAALERLVRRAAPYRDLSTPALVTVLDMLTGRYASTALADLRPRLRWDRATDVLSARRGTALVARTNAGTIPDRGTYGVYLGEGGPRIGELDEEMVYESRDGDTFLLGTSTWRVEEITRDRVIVSPAPGEPGRLPFWKGDGPGRPLELGRAIGAFVRECAAELGRGGDGPRERLAAWLARRLPLDAHAAGNLAAYLDEQVRATGALPTDRAITVERFRDELGDWRVCLLTPFGRPVHAPWAMAIEERLARTGGPECQVMYTDDGVVLRLPDTGEGRDGEPEVDLDALLPAPEEVTELVTERVGRTALFSALFRENAVRSLLVTRRRPDQRNPLWAQRLKTRALLATVRDLPDFPVVVETYRQALGDELDLVGLESVLRDVRARAIRVDRVDTPSPSPFARSLVFAFVAAYLYDGDSPVAERKAQALTLDKELLRELLGQVELRELIDPGALAELEAELEGSAEGWRARDRDELLDLLRRVGDLTAEEVAERVDGAECPDGGAAWSAELERERRAVRVRVLGQERLVAADDAAILRDALGTVLPPGLPEAFLAPVGDALVRLVRRFARGRGPFAAGDLTRRYGLASERVLPVLAALERADVLVRGELRPSGTGEEWCDAEVLRRLKRKTLARLRREAAAVDAAAFARFLPRWHGVAPRVVGRAGEDVDGPARGGVRDPRTALLEAVERLEGAALPWSALVLDLLPARVPGFQQEALDLLAAGGELVWVGRGALGARDGRVALLRRADAPLLLDPAAPSEPASAVHAALLDELAGGAARFLTELERAVRARCADLTTSELEAALWDLVWAGLVTNDTFAPLRTLGRPTRSRATRGGWRGVLAGGRWSRVDALLAPPVPSETERALARARVLLARYGVVSREAARAEELEGGFGGLYRTLRALEESGRARRGWFVEGLSGAQFALPGAVDALRARDDDGRPHHGAHEVHVLSAVDPAQPFGALLAWPGAAGERSGARRAAGALVCLVDGEPQWWLAPSRRQLVVLAAEAGGDAERASRLDRAFEALARLPRRGRRRVELETVDGAPATDSPHTERLLAHGFARDHRRLSAVDARL